MGTITVGSGTVHHLGLCGHGRSGTLNNDLGKTVRKCVGRSKSVFIARGDALRTSEHGLIYLDAKGLDLLI